MKKVKRRLGISLILSLPVFGWLFLGIYSHPEYTNSYLFIKHRPSTTFNFVTCRESDLCANEVPRHLIQQEKLYKEFIDDGKGNKRSIYIPYL